MQDLTSIIIYWKYKTYDRNTSRIYGNYKVLLASLYFYNSDNKSKMVRYPEWIASRTTNKWLARFSCLCIWAQETCNYRRYKERSCLWSCYCTCLYHWVSKEKSISYVYLDFLDRKNKIKCTRDVDYMVYVEFPNKDNGQELFEVIL